MMRLARLCESKLRRTVDASNAPRRLVVADKGQAEDLREVCIRFIAPHVTQVMQSEGWNDLISYVGLPSSP